MIRDIMSALITFALMVGVISLAAHSVDNTRARYESITNR